MYGRNHTPEARAKMSAFRLGKPLSEETRRRMSEAQILAKSQRTPEQKAATFQAMSAAIRGRKQSSEWIEKVRTAITGRKLSDEHRKTLSLVRKGVSYGPRSAEQNVKLSGPNHWNWQGGRPQDRGGYLNLNWKRAVHKRDNHTCQMCGIPNLSGRNQQADHIQSWRDFPDLRFELSNGRTLCGPCHAKRSGPQVRDMIRANRERCLDTFALGEPT